MKEQGKIGDNRQNVPLQKVQLPKEGVVVGVIGGVFMSSIPQTQEFKDMVRNAEERIRRGQY